MTDQPQGVVHGVVEELELPPEPPPHGPKIWIQENLLAGDTPMARAFNGLLSVVFGLIALNVLQYVTSYIFDPTRRWSAVTFNMKLMMVQAFPQADLFRIWLSVGIFFVLVSISLVVWGGGGGRLSLFSLAKLVRNIGVLLMLTTVMHGATGASKLVSLPLLTIDSPADWSSGRLIVFLIGLAIFGAGFLYLRNFGTVAKERSVPVLSVLVVAMGLITLTIWTIELPIPEGQFGETTASIARSTTGPWTILFLVAIGSYFLGRLLVGVVEVARLKRLLVYLWVFSYPIIIMVIQRKPVLDWGDLLGGGPTPFQESALGLFIIFSVVGGAVIWWLALSTNVMIGRVIAFSLGIAIGATPWFVESVPAWTPFVAAFLGLALIVGGGFIRDGIEIARVIGLVLGFVTILVWFVPMIFIVRGMLIAFALTAITAPSFGGSPQARVRVVAVWVALAFLVVATFVLGGAETALEFQSTTFLGGFNLSILLAITGLVLSFPLGVILALARTSTMPIFRLLATGYIELIRSVPMITWLFFGAVMLPVFLPSGIAFDEIVRVIGIVAIFNAAYVAENIRGGLQSIGKGQYEAASAMGLTTVQSTALIVLPQAIRAVLPALVGSIIVSFKDTSLVAIIGLADVLFIAKSFVPGQTSPHNFLGTQPQMLFFIALFYWVFTFSFSRMALRYEKSIGLGEH
ncbi:MAG: amino acid ABC transporter permease [Acidimicrobiia bacterium]|nr:amino acid ABC transporter permease [Acidimicrobiia bacterium]